MIELLGEQYEVLYYVEKKQTINTSSVNPIIKGIVNAWVAFMILDMIQKELQKLRNNKNE